MHNANDQRHQLTVKFDTPGAADSRTTALVLEAGLQPKVYASAALDTPVYKATAEAGWLNDAQSSFAYAQYSSGDKKFTTKLGVQKTAGPTGDAKSATYTPIAQVQLPGIAKPEDSINGWKVTGTIVGEWPKPQHSRFRFNNVQLQVPAGAAQGANAEPLTLNGEAALEDGVAKCDVQLTQGKERSVSLKGELRPKSDDFKLDATVQNSVFAPLNGRVAFELERKEGVFRNDVVLVAGKDAANSNRKVELHQAYTYKRPAAGERPGAEHFVRGEARLAAPFAGCEAQLKGELTAKLAKLEASAKVGKHRVAGKLNGKMNEKATGDYDVQAEASADKHVLKVEAKRTIDEGHSKLTQSVDLNGEAHAELTVEFDHEPTYLRALVKVNGHARLAKADEPHR